MNTFHLFKCMEFRSELQTLPFTKARWTIDVRGDDEFLKNMIPFIIYETHSIGY